MVAVRGKSPVLLIFIALSFAAILLQSWWAIVEDRRVTLQAEQDNTMLTARLLEDQALSILRDAERRLDLIRKLLLRLDQAQPEADAIIKQRIIRALQENRFLEGLEYVIHKASAGSMQWITPRM